jgi:hypothetical protein
VKAEEIRHALVMVARGFPNHPDVLSFADKLAEVFAGWVAPPTVVPDAAPAELSPLEQHAVAFKRRSKKAE